MLTSTILFANNAPNWIDQFKTDLIIKMTSLAILVFVLCFGSLVCDDGNNCHLTYKKMICFRFFRPNIDNCMQKKIPFELETYQKIKICVAGTIQCVSVFAACKGKKFEVKIYFINIWIVFFQSNGFLFSPSMRII